MNNGRDSDLMLQPEEPRPQRQRMWLSDLSINQPVLITMFVLAAVVIGGIFYVMSLIIAYEFGRGC